LTGDFSAAATLSGVTPSIAPLQTPQLKSARHQRETYVGPWLPRPIVEEEDAATLPPRRRNDRHAWPGEHERSPFAPGEHAGGVGGSDDENRSERGLEGVFARAAE
jgi:hypothetical protein